MSATPDAQYLQQLVDDGLPCWVAEGPALDKLRLADAFGWVEVRYGTRADGKDTFGRPGDGLLLGLTPAGQRLLASHRQRKT